MIEIDYVTEKDIEHVAKNMREADKTECIAFHQDPKEAIEVSLAMSSFSIVGRVNGKAIAIFGCAELKDGGGGVWLLGTDEIKHNVKDFLRHSKITASFLLEKYKYLTNSVWAEHKESIRWLKHLGAVFNGEQRIIDGKEFLTFHIYGRE